jgi:hypothetical protein
LTTISARQFDTQKLPTTASAESPAKLGVASDMQLHIQR